MIRGSKNVEKYLRNQLDVEKDKFRKVIEGRESKFLFVLLQSLNYLVGSKLLSKRNGLVDKIDLPVYRLLTSQKAMLDIILEQGSAVTQMVCDEEFIELFSSLSQHMKIGFLSEMLRLQKESRTNSIRVRNGEIVEAPKSPRKFAEAFQHWVDIGGIDSDWINWYYGRSQEKRARVGLLLKNAFRKMYNLDLDDLSNISQFFEDISKEHFNKTSWTVRTTPFMYLKRKWLRQEFLKHMDRDSTEKWLKLLEYGPRRDFYKSPLIPLVFHGSKVYTLMTWVFTPANHFWGRG